VSMMVDLKVMAYFKISLSTRNWDRAFVQVVQDYHNDLDSVAGKCVRTGEGGGSPMAKKERASCPLPR
ncbi:hypothetical protein ACET98_01200, partial [Aeromonas veronii]